MPNLTRNQLIWVLCAVVLFACFGWPTPYRYDRMSVHGGISYPVRISRITGEAQYLTPIGWRDMAPEEH